MCCWDDRQRPLGDTKASRRHKRKECDRSVHCRQCQQTMPPVAQMQQGGQLQVSVIKLDEPIASTSSAWETLHHGMVGDVIACGADACTGAWPSRVPDLCCNLDRTARTAWQPSLLCATHSATLCIRTVSCKSLRQTCLSQEYCRWPRASAGVGSKWHGIRARRDENVRMGVQYAPSTSDAVVVSATLSVVVCMISRVRVLWKLLFWLL